MRFDYSLSFSMISMFFDMFNMVNAFFTKVTFPNKKFCFQTGWGTHLGESGGESVDGVWVWGDVHAAGSILVDSW